MNYINKNNLFKKEFDVYNHIYISKSALLNNLGILSKISKNQVIPVLKSNAYGHGIEQIAKILKNSEIPYIAVDGYYEALRVINVCRHKILVLGSILPTNFSRINTRNCTFSVHSTDTIDAMGRTNKLFRVHVELETGMSRHGVKIDELVNFMSHLKQYKNIRVDGIMSHLADADNPDNDEFTKHQVELFDRGVEMIRLAGYDPQYIHIAQSAGSAKIKSKYANTIRGGIGLYGISPLQIDDQYSKVFNNLQPVLRLSSTISKTINIDPSDSVSYSRTFIATQPTTVGILPIGYYEGLPRAFSNKSYVTRGNTKSPIIGRVCMNHTMIDITKSNLTVTDEVDIISNDKHSDICVDKLCEKHELFRYSLLCGLSNNIRRTIVD